MTKKKILEFVLVGTSAAAVGTGVAVPAAIVTNQQSSSVNIEDDKNNGNDGNNQGGEVVNPGDNQGGEVVVNPGDNQGGEVVNPGDNQGGGEVTPGGNQGGEIVTPGDDKNDPVVKDFAKAPTELTYNSAINWSQAEDSQSLNTFLYTKFHGVTANVNSFFKETTENKDALSNAVVEYVSGSASYEKSTFQVKITPSDGYTWEDSTNLSRTLVVQMPNLDKTAWVLTAPQSLNYSAKIDTNTVTNSAQLNSFLSNKFELAYLNVGNENLSVSYVNNSASFENKSFQVSLTPKSGFAWTDGTTVSKSVKVTANLVKVETLSKTSKYSSNDKYRNPINLGQASSSKSLDRFLDNDFRITNLQKTNEYSNVYMEYVKGSADYDANQFKIKISPLSGFAWADGTTTPVIQTVNANLDKNFANYDTKTAAESGKIFATEAPKLTVIDNNNSFVTYKVSSWSFASHMLRDEINEWVTSWNISVDGGKTWQFAGQGQTVTVNKSKLPGTGLWLNYKIEAREIVITTYTPNAPLFTLYETNATRILD